MYGSLISIFLIACVQPLFVLAGGGGAMPTTIALLVAGLALYLFSFRNLSIVKQEFFDRHLIVTGIYCGAGTVIMANAVLYTNVAIVQFISLLSPVFAALLCLFGFFDEKITRAEVYAFLVGLIGIIFLSFLQSSDAPKDDPFIGLLLTLTGTLFITITALRLKLHANKPVATATQAAFLSWAGIFLLPFAIVFPANLETKQLFYVIIIGLLFAFGNWALLWGLKTVTASKMLLLRPMGAVWATIISYFILGQNVTWLFYLGAIFILASVIMLAKEPDNQEQVEN